MFELDQAVSNWKQRLLREQALAPERVEELEDHLRASVESLCHRGAGEREAFEEATRRIGRPGEIGDEFRKLRPRAWKLLLGTGWACYALSFFVPVFREGGTLLEGKLPGWEAIHGAFVYGEIYGKLSALTNLVMLLTPLALPVGARRAPRVLLSASAVAVLLNLRWAGDLDLVRAGYFLWWLSFVAVTAGLFVRSGYWETLRERMGSRSRGTAGV